MRQGYQTNMWGMPTYYLLRSGLLEKHGVKFEEFAVPSGNLTMQQMVARQVDMGTYAGPSFSIGHDKGGLVAIAMIEYVGKTARVLARKDLGITKVEQLKGLKVANQSGSSTGNIFVDQIATKAGLEEGRLPGNPHERERHGGRHGRQDRGRHGQCRALQRHRGSRRPGGDDLGILRLRQAAGVHGGDAGIRREEPADRGRLSQGLARSRQGLQEQPKKVADAIYSFYTSKGYKMATETFAKALARVEVQPGWPADLVPYMTHHSEILVQEKKIKAVPDWSKALRIDFLKKAMA